MTRALAGLLLVTVLGIAAAAAEPAPASAGSPKIDSIVSGTVHQPLFAVAFDNDRGIAVGEAGAILLSDDNGASWHAAKGSGATALSLFGVDVRGSSRIAVGQSGLILVADQAGVWQPVSSGTRERLFAVSVNSQGTAVAVGAFGTLLRSSDGGRSWASIAPPDITQYSDQGAQPHLYAVMVAEPGTITVAGEFGLVLRSDDGGAHWKATHKGTASLFALDLHQSSGAGYAVGQEGTVLRTLDGGSTWSDVNCGSKANLLSVSANAGGEVIVTAMHDMLVSTGGTWRQADWGDFGSAWYSGVRFVGGDSSPVAILVGHSGRVLRMSL